MSDGKDDTALERIESVHVKGFRSLVDVKLDSIPNPMVLLGANGAGKSNLLRFFEMLRETYQYRLSRFVARRGGADDQLFGGEKETRQIHAAVRFHTGLGVNDLSFTLSGNGRDQLDMESEEFHCKRHNGRGGYDYGAGRAAPESTFCEITHSPKGDPQAKAAIHFLRDCSIYQFNDTSGAAPIQKRWDVEDRHRLLEHGGNLGPVLLRLREHHLSKYKLICRHIRRVLPEFDDFQLEEEYGKTILRWRGKTTGQTLGAHLTSDGSLRCFCLLTLLSLPDEVLPRVILLDEPELGLHPFATSLVSHMVKSLSQRRQVIVATQSPHFVDAFGLDDIVVLEMRDGRTETKRLNKEDFSEWLDDHSSGQLWWSNLLGGYP